MHAGCPQGTPLGPLAFVVHINDLSPPNADLTIKYVDDTSILHASCDGTDNSMQNSAQYLQQWATVNNMVFNVKKTKEIVFHFGEDQNNFPSAAIGDDIIEQVPQAKVLGVTIQSDLKWNSHITNIIKKANKRLYLLRLCKRAGVRQNELLCIYTSLIRSLLEYCAVVWHPALPSYLHNDIEQVQKRAIKLIYPSCDYDSALASAKLDSLFTRREEQCRKLFNDMKLSSHKLHSSLPCVPDRTYNFRHQRIPHVMCRTSRYSKTFVSYCIRNFQ